MMRRPFKVVPIGPKGVRHSGPDRERRVAVIDVGSNSIRMVVYDRLSRTPIPVFNEKVLCGLGRALSETGRLSPDGKAQALDNLARFNRLLEGMAVDRVDVLATAAVRDAADGEDFITEVRRRCDLPVSLISGTEEARLSALGVLSGIPDADGVAGDLGGGSLELVGLDGAVIAEQETLPLGPLRLMDAKNRKAKARRLVDDTLAGQAWLDRYRGRAFYPVGGNWRALAKLHMGRAGHPLTVIHQYTVPAAEIAQLADAVAKQGKSALERLPGVPKRRAETLPYAALVMAGLLGRLQPQTVVFSALGLREGHLYDLLPAEDQARDPLLAACADIAHRLDRFGHAELIADWTAGLFADEDARFARLRKAAGLISDIGWADHPDYRAEHAFLRVLRFPFIGIDHAERAFLAMAIHARYGGSAGDTFIQPASRLLSEEDLRRTTLLGLTLRLAHTLTGGACGLLERTRLDLGPDAVVVTLPEDEAVLAGDAVQRRLDGVAKVLGRDSRIIIQPEAEAAARA